jgi:hypothetical protein
MSRTTHHFDWRKLEEKPDNWETLRQLINICNNLDDIYTEQVSTNPVWNNLSMEVFKTHILGRYGKNASKYFVNVETLTKTIQQNQKNKKTKNNLREKIQQETEKKILEKDFGMIRFDNDKPIRTTFRISSVFYFMIAEWNLKLLCQKPLVAKKGVVIDAMISLDRILLEEIAINPMIPATIRTFFQELNMAVSQLLPRHEVFDELFCHHPELMVNPFSQKRVGRTSLYKEQVELLTHVMDAVMTGSPLLLGDRMPPGTGKTFLAVPLAQKLLALRCGKTLLFACHNPLVRMDVASLSLLGKSLHLWMGRYDNSSGKKEYLVRPHKSCFPVNWKQVYKTQDEKKTAGVYQQCVFYKNETGRFPDILVADLETCAEILRDDMLRDQFVAYIDEFVSDEYANSVMVEIVKHLPKQSILLSAILPRFEDMPSVIQYFKDKYSVDDNHIVRIESNQLLISCTMVAPDGCSCLPHHFIDTVGQVPILIQRIREDPLIGRMYSPQQVFIMTEHIREDLESHMLFHHRFPTIGLIDHQKIRDYVLDLLQYTMDHPHVFEKIKAFRPRLMDQPSLEKIATEDSHHYQGKTLVITTTEDRFPILEKIKQTLHDNAPNLQVMLETLEKKKKELLKTLQSTKEIQRSSQQRIDATDQQQRVNRLEEELYSVDRIHWPHHLIVNTSAHARRFNHSLSNMAVVPILPREYEDAFSDFLLSLLLSGIGVYDFSQCTEYQRRLTMKLMKQLSFLFAGHEIVFGTNIDGLTHLFIDGNYGDGVSRNVLLQLCGRVGRVGHSYEALLVVNSNQTLHKIMDFIDPTDVDAQYFEQQFQDILKQSQQ